MLRHPTGPDGTTGFALKRKSIASEAEISTPTNEELVLENGTTCEDPTIKESTIQEQVEALSVS